MQTSTTNDKFEFLLFVAQDSENNLSQTDSVEQPLQKQDITLPSLRSILTRFQIPGVPALETNLIAKKENSPQPYSTPFQKVKELTPIPSPPQKFVHVPIPKLPPTPPNNNLPLTAPPQQPQNQDESNPVFRPFPCTVDKCKKRFPTKAHLNRHLKTHSGEKPFKCILSTCPKRFSRRDNMIQHFRLFHSDQEDLKDLLEASRS